MAVILWCWCPSVVKSTSKEFLSFPFKRFSTTTDRFYLIGHHEKRTAAAAAVDGWGSVEDLNDSLKKGEREREKKMCLGSSLIFHGLWGQKAPLRPRRSDYSRKKRSIKADYKRTHTHTCSEEEEEV